MSNLVLQSREGLKPHPEGVHSAVCVDVIDLGLCDVEFQGQTKRVQKIRIAFESEAVEDGKRCVVTKSFTASLHPKARLAEFLGKWRGRPITPGETIDLQKLIGAGCTLVISHQQNLVGRTYACIDAVMKPTKKVTPGGQYDPAEARRKIAEARAREMEGASAGRAMPASVPAVPVKREVAPAAPKSAPAVAVSAPAAEPEYDPEVGF